MAEQDLAASWKGHKTLFAGLNLQGDMGEVLSLKASTSP